MDELRLEVFSLGDVLNRSDRAPGAPFPAETFKTGERSHEHPAKLTPPIEDSMLDIEQSVPVRIVGAPDRGENSICVVRMNVRQNLRQRRRLVRIPAVHLTELERPIDGAGFVVVIEDPDVTDSDRLKKALVISCIDLPFEPSLIAASLG